MPTPIATWLQATSRIAPQLLAGLTLVLVVLGMTLGYRVSESAGLAQLAAMANERLELYATTLETELARYAYLPSLIAIDEDVQALLDDPHDAHLQQRARLKLARVNVRAGSILIFVTSADGEALAGSNGYQSRGGGVPGGPRRCLQRCASWARTPPIFLLRTNPTARPTTISCSPCGAGASTAATSL
jgi:hypothetical protein